MRYMHLFIGLENIGGKFPYFVVNWVDIDTIVCGLAVVKIESREEKCKMSWFPSNQTCIPTCVYHLLYSKTPKV